MADNVAITAGTGTTIGTDDVGGVQIQRVKNTWGPDGTANDTDVASGKPMPVQLRSSTGTDLIGTAGTASAAVITVQGISGGTTQPVVAAATNILLTSLAPTAAAFTPAATSHTAKDCVGAATTFSGVGASGKQVMICGATFSIATTTPVASAFRLHLFNAAPTVINDDSPFTLASTDIAKYLGWIDLGSAFDLDSTAQWISVDGLAKPVLLASADIIGYLQNLTTVTLEAVAHQVTLFTYPLS